jgi:RHS repeat-associated protein
VKSTASVGATDYYPAGQQVVETRYTLSGGASALQYQFVWSPRYIDAPILRDDLTAGSTCPRAYYLNDANMNVTACVNPAGVVLERYVYDAYGIAAVYNANWSDRGSASAFGNALLYTGQRFDLETTLYYYKRRFCSPALGRFLSRDPIGYTGGINVYEYAGDRPTSVIDPTGSLAVYFQACIVTIRGIPCNVLTATGFCYGCAQAIVDGVQGRCGSMCCNPTTAADWTAAAYAACVGGCIASWASCRFCF